jgi:transcription initiation factor TFIIIB Brf1 subunit/transcription initiation factor TFIIB
VVVRIIEQFDLGNDKSKIKRQILNECERVEGMPKLMGKTPSGVASAVIYSVLIRLGIKITKETVCTAASVSVPTLNKIELLLKQ